MDIKSQWNDIKCLKVKKLNKDYYIQENYPGKRRQNDSQINNEKMNSFSQSCKKKTTQMAFNAKWINNGISIQWNTSQQYKRTNY
jgi:hypothetical protein